MSISFPNQRTITINRTLPVKGDKKKFLAAYYENITMASRLLTGEVAFKLYLYLLSNQDKYTDYFSPQSFSNDFGVSADRTRKVFEQLIEVGYLVQIANNKYEFYEVPQKQPELKNKVKEETRKVEFFGGITKIMTYSAFVKMYRDRGMADEVIKENWLLQEIVDENEMEGDN